MREAKKLYLCFKYEKLRDDKNTQMNRWLVRASDIIEGCYCTIEPYRHVELVTQDGYSYTIRIDGYVTKSTRQFSSSTYDNNSLVITVSDDQYGQCIDFLEEKRLNKDIFFKNFELSFIPIVNCFIGQQKPNEWFCSQLIANALQDSGIMTRDCDPRKITPQILYDKMLSQVNCAKTSKSGFINFNDI
jgi:hypothetical protein